MHLKTVAQYIRRSPYQSFAAIFIMTLTFFMISVFSLVTILSVRLIDYFEKSPQLTIFFKDEAKVEEILDIKKQYEATGKVSTIRYISKEEALEIYRKIFADDPRLLELVTADVLPPSLEIQAVKAEYLSDLATMIKDSPLVDEISFLKDVVDTFISWVNAFKTIGFVLIGMLLVTSVLVILTIIAFKILVRREEIEIMRLLGATSWFIRIPFLYEGMFYGFTGAFLGWIFSLGVLYYATPFIESSLKGIPIFPIPPLLLAQVLGGELVIAIILGAFASYLAVLRYLK